MVETKMINIAKDYTVTPGFRLKSQGEYSGEDFRIKFLEPIFEKNPDSLVVVNLDGVKGYAISFLEEAFGGLARKFTEIDFNEHIKIISTEEPYLVDDIRGYIQNAKNC
ncbi:MAG: STAS-like domain-containing protein [Synergistaceae bacterium]|nr:STAS-like domain-containing protein [Candidatus Equadaptatus faecalis]